MMSKKDFSDLDITPGRDDLPDGSDSVSVAIRTARDGTRAALLLPSAAERLIKRHPDARDLLQELQDAARAIAAERAVLDALIPELRALGASWDTLGWYLGVTGNTVRNRWDREKPSGTTCVVCGQAPDEHDFAEHEYKP